MYLKSETKWLYWWISPRPGATSIIYSFLGFWSSRCWAHLRLRRGLWCDHVNGLFSSESRALRTASVWLHLRRGRGQWEQTPWTLWRSISAELLELWHMYFILKHVSLAPPLLPVAQRLRQSLLVSITLPLGASLSSRAADCISIVCYPLQLMEQLAIY